MLVLSDKSFRGQPEKHFSSYYNQRINCLLIAVAILKDEWRLEHNIDWNMRSDLLLLASEISRIFWLFLVLFHYLAKNFDRDYMLRDIEVFICVPVT